MVNPARNRRRRSRLTQTELDGHHHVTKKTNIWIAALAALPPTILALATLTQALHLETKIDGRLTQLLETTAQKATAEAAQAAAKNDAQTAKETLEAERKSHHAPAPRYDPPKKSGL